MTPTFAPNPPPPSISPEQRVVWLREQLKLPENQRQRINITALIDLYESGQLGPLRTGKTTWLCDGKIIEDPLRGRAGDLPNGVLWAEVSFSCTWYWDIAHSSLGTGYRKMIRVRIFCFAVERHSCLVRLFKPR